ncbi:PDR/VanB family oxidoreductase [Pseudomonas citri]|uniref:PDR/VanB family oxidoreductase n=1 Tax=Pseudomonas citri TaxID=2978349 RepID=UPI0021B571EC|nr:PDR/VanB family oxidoreductase [Pseudomonas citri]
MPALNESLEVYVKSVTHEAKGILAYELRSRNDEDLPPFTAGAHIDLRMEAAPVRSYSLLNSPSDRSRYVIAISLNEKGRGGSIHIHKNLHCGDSLIITGPRNNFPLAEDAKHSVLIAGGIGITPIWSMAQRLTEIDAHWELHYGARSRDCAALLEVMENHPYSRAIHTCYSEGEQAEFLDLKAIVARDDGHMHFYCCGPAVMLEAFKEATREVPAERVHFESFSAEHEASLEGGFVVELARSGKSIEVTPGQSILDALLGQGIEVMNSCREGICGACEVRVLEGTPDHRDSILSDSEKQAGKTMFVCCSGSQGNRLVLDL